jgi:hypothetical protein
MKRHYTRAPTSAAGGETVTREGLEDSSMAIGHRHDRWPLGYAGRMLRVKSPALRLVLLSLASSASMVGCFGNNADQPAPDASFPFDGADDVEFPDARGPSDDGPASTDVGADSAAPRDGGIPDAPAPPTDASIDSAGDSTIDSPTDSSVDSAIDVSIDSSVDSSIGSSDAGEDAALTYPQVVLADAPLSYWRFGESTGTVAVDETGADNGAYGATGVTLGAPGAIANDPNTAATFDGMSGYVDMGAGFAFGGTSPMSYEAWVKPNPADSSARRFMSKETSNGSGRQGFLMAYELGGTPPDGGPPANLLSWERWLDNAPDALIAVVTPGVYQHVVVTYDGSTMTMYLNGQSIASAPSTQGIAALADPFRVATYSDFLAAADCFGGTIDEVAIYDHALGAARVLLHYEVGTGM